MTGPRPVTDLLGRTGSPLAALARGARERSRLDRALGEFLNQPLRAHVHVACARDGVLVLAAETPVWGHRIRYLAPAILERMRGLEPHLVEVRIIVRPVRGAPPAPDPGRRASLSRPTASMLRKVAAACDNPGLARALERLARRAR